MTISSGLPDWADYQSIMAGAQTALDLLVETADPQLRQEANRLLFAAMAAGYQTVFADPDLPDFVPSVSSILNMIGVNPDFVYGYTRLDGAGIYRLSGLRGDALLVFVDFAAGGLGVLDDLGPSVGMLDLDRFRIAPDGGFDILLSAERPPRHDGDWFALDLRTTTAALRCASYEWGAGADTKVAIERVDRPIAPRRLDADEIAWRLQRLAAFVERYARFALGYGARHRAQGFVNRLEHDDWAGRGGVIGQHYYQGMFRLTPGEAMIVETEIPVSVRYWNIQLNDPLWNSIDWINRQSSLNAAQARLDGDGRFRAVIALEDPGVPNWLDPGGHREGSLMLRWTEASSGPEPTLAIVPIAALRDRLPGDTPHVDAQARQTTLRARRRGAQLRRRW